MAENGGHGYYTADAVKQIMREYFEMNLQSVTEDVTATPYTEEIR